MQVSHVSALLILLFAAQGYPLTTKADEWLCVMEAAGYCLLRCQQQLSEELQKHFFPKPGVQIGDCMHRWVPIQILVWPWSHRKYTWLYTNCRRCSRCRLHCCALQTSPFATAKCESGGNARCFLGDHCGDKISMPCKAVEILPLTLAMQGFHPLCFFLLLLCFTKLCIVWDSSKIAFIKLTERLEGSRKD